LGGNLTSAPAVARNLDGRLEVFAVWSDNNLHHIWQTAPNNGWSNWQCLGGGLAFPHPAVGPNADARLEVFALSNQGDQHIWQQ
jgi:hypothetical protein